MNILSLVAGPLVEAVQSFVMKKQETKARQNEIDGALQTKRLEQISKSDDYAQAFRLAQVQTAGWRPGFWTIVLAAPVVLCFVPHGAQYVQAGFEALKVSTPGWFQYFLGMAISSAFGYQVVDKAYEWWKAP